MLRTLFPMLFTGDGDVLQTLAKTPTTPIAEIEDGRRVKVTGQVLETSATTRALLSGVPAVCTRTIVDVAFARTNGWMHLVDRFHCQPFRIRDETGEAQVESQHVRLAGVVDSDSHASMSPTDRAALTEILAASQFGFSAWADNLEFRDASERLRGVRVRETVLASHDRATVLGIARSEASRVAPREALGYRSMATELVLRGSRRRPLLIAKQS